MRKESTAEWGLRGTCAGACGMRRQRGSWGSGWEEGELERAGDGTRKNGERSGGSTEREAVEKLGVRVQNASAAWRGWRHGGLEVAAAHGRRRRRRRVGDDGGTMVCGGSGDNGDVLVAGARSGGGGGWTPSLAFREQPLEREETPFFSQMTARVCGGGVPSPLIEPIMGREGEGLT